MIISKTIKTKSKKCDICTGPLKWKETKGQGESQRQHFSCTVCGHLQIHWKHLKLANYGDIRQGKGKTAHTQN